MNKMCIIKALVLSAFLSASTGFAQDAWKFEVVPYAWLTGIEADVSAGSRKAEVDLGFEDLFDALDVGGSFLTVTQYNKWVLWTQLDYFSLDTDKLDNAPERARFEMESLFVTAAFGYQFNTFGDSSTLDVLAGARYLNLDSDITVGNIGSGGGESQIWDGIVMLRPSFQLLDWLKFNPTLSIGTGDSDLTYELQPQFQFQLSDIVVARLGYRRLYYDIKNSRRDFDGDIHGLIAGIGFVF